MAKKFPTLSGKLVLAPMHEVTNIAFRIMCKQYGAALVSTELLSANAIARENNAIINLAKTAEAEKPIACQIFSNNTENMINSAKIIEKKGFDIIDINFGCPSKKIMQQGSGGALLGRKNKVYEIVNRVSSSVNIPVTVKIRLGINKKEINVLEVAKLCEDAGASAVTIHARTVEQGYSGKADWDHIKQAKEILKIPVIGNGDVKDGKSAKEILEQTKCDYVMIGRAAIGNPFIFKEITEFLKTGKIIKQTKEEKIKDYFRYIELAKKYEVFELKDTKQKAIEFTKGIIGSSKLRQKLNHAKTWEEIKLLVEKFYTIKLNPN